MANLSIWQFVGLYLVLQVIYVILNTITNITKIKCGKMIASITSAICYGFYVIVVVATASNQPLWVKMVLTAITNLIGVYFGMAIMEKLKKDKLWEITATIKGNKELLEQKLAENDISYNTACTSRINEYIFHIYSKSQKESALVKKWLVKYNAKYIVHEENVKL